jgi:hypothetical protein
MSDACALDRHAQSISYDKTILVGNGHTWCAVRPRAGAELIALGRAGASVEVAGGAANICRHYS